MVHEKSGEVAAQVTELPQTAGGEGVTGGVPMRFYIWGNRKLIGQKDAGVSRCIQASAVAGLPVIARGMTTLVFDADDKSVWKLTVDKATYNMLEGQRGWLLEGLPAVLELQGHVGETSDGLNIWLYRQERLQRLVHSTSNRKEAMRLKRESDSLFRQGVSDGDRLAVLGRGAKLPHIAEALKKLSTFVTRYQRPVGLDIHASNFMLRASSDACVLADPFFDLEVLAQAQAAYRVRYHLGPEVAIV